LNILDQADRYGGFIVNVFYDNRDAIQARQLSRSPTTLARQNFEPVCGDRPDNNGLQNALCLNAGGERLQGFLIKLSTRLKNALLKPLYRQIIERLW
jgi:hypothetical protein